MGHLIAPSPMDQSSCPPLQFELSLSAPTPPCLTRSCAWLYGTMLMLCSTTQYLPYSHIPAPNSTWPSSSRSRDSDIAQIPASLNPPRPVSSLPGPGSCSHPHTTRPRVLGLGSWDLGCPSHPVCPGRCWLVTMQYCVTSDVSIPSNPAWSCSCSRPAASLSASFKNL